MEHINHYGTEINYHNKKPFNKNNCNFYNDTFNSRKK